MPEDVEPDDVEPDEAVLEVEDVPLPVDGVFEFVEEELPVSLLEEPPGSPAAFVPAPLPFAPEPEARELVR